MPLTTQFPAGCHGQNPAGPTTAAPAGGMREGRSEPVKTAVRTKHKAAPDRRAVHLSPANSIAMKGGFPRQISPADTGINQT